LKGLAISSRDAIHTNTSSPHHERLLQAISAAYLDIIYFCVDAKKTFRKLKRWTTGNVLVPHLRKPTDACSGSSFDVGKTLKDTLDKFRAHVKNVEKEAGGSHMIEASHERQLAKADRARREIERKGLIVCPGLEYT